LKALCRVSTEAGYVKLLESPRRIDVEAALYFVFKVIDDNLFNAAFDGAVLSVEVALIPQQAFKCLAKALVDVA
jgi:hypothetical protein